MLYVEWFKFNTLVCKHVLKMFFVVYFWKWLVEFFLNDIFFLPDFHLK